MSNLDDLFSERPAETSGVLGATEGVAAQVAPVSATVLDLDRWGLRRGRELAEEWREQDIATHDPELVSDAHGALFEPDPKLSEKPQDASRAAWWKQLMETPEYRNLHNQTMLDPMLSGIAAKSVCDQWMDYAADQPEPEDGDPAPGSDEEPIGDTLKRIRSTGNCLKQAAKEVQTAKDTAEGLGIGLGNGDGTKLDQATLMAYFRKIKDSDFLRRVFQWAGRYKSLCQSLQRRKVRHGRDDMVGVELGGDVARLVPSELAQMCCGIEEVELLAMYRLVQRQSLCRQYRGIEPVGRGPIVLSLDESGSMGGQRIEAAKGIALTLAWLARHQKRWIVLVSFGGTRDCEFCAMPPGKWDQDKLLEWITHFYGGGTVPDVPLDVVPNVLWNQFVAQGMPRGRTDHVIVTDGQMYFDEDMTAKYKAWAGREQVKTYGLMIGVGDAGKLAEVCEKTWCVENLDIDTAGISDILSV